MASRLGRSVGVVRAGGVGEAPLATTDEETAPRDGVARLHPGPDEAGEPGAARRRRPQDDTEKSDVFRRVQVSPGQDPWNRSIHFLESTRTVERYRVSGSGDAVWCPSSLRRREAVAFDVPGGGVDGLPRTSTAGESGGGPRLG
jgi:hypothetical protein